MPLDRTAPLALPVSATTPGAESVHLQLFRDVLRRFGRGRLRVNGTSMLPALWPGDVVEVVATDMSQLCRGDVLLVERDARLFCHRFLGFLPHSGRLLVRTKGDALDQEDPPICPEAVLGRVEACHGAARPPDWLALLLCCLATVWQRPLAWMIRWRPRHSLIPPEAIHERS